ncbi:Sodium/calcium exchanger protein-domain-containing protein [Aspergillus minisclerotigenes]|uniref:Sodium/calcium exchanger protein-domain-containing protein n=1 Tax=Aspergillus minisclerotigenes TaxID=656917 RepID=A0A5N6IU41_9EURO|nr:Sodium/calcium exchanger protein-domain-containing protein [Aspergillus minisclerotigenes]
MSEILSPVFSRPSGRRYSVRPFYWTLMVITTLAVLSWVGGLYEDEGIALPVKRFLRGGGSDRQGIFKRGTDLECRMVRKAHDKCSYVRMNCPDHEDGLFSYLQFYYCALAGAKPFAFTILVLWLSLLFSTIGIAASDFLCIDLSTLAGALGLSESLAGVTFLAFGNGSPDVFSTFAAMKSNSGSLAIGELLGAASFITSVVAGSMALVRPFKVARRSFVRDVGYFIVAVSFSMLLLADGRLHAWESAAMVALYCFYVVLVVTWHWYFVRRRRVYERDIAARSHFHIPENQELEIEEADDDDPGIVSESTSLLHGVSVEDFDVLERGGEASWKDGDDDETRNRYLAEIRDNMHLYRPSVHRRNTLNPIRPSLVGALEFQSVVSSLQRSRSTHQNVPISLQRYTDGYDGSRAAHPERDSISVASHPWISKPSATGHLSPNSGTGSTRTRAVSADDVTGLKLDTSIFASGAERPRVAITRPSVDDPTAFVQTQTHQTNKSGESEFSSLSSRQAWRSPSPEGSARPRTPQLLAPPGIFHPPNYQAETPEPRSPLEVSPRETPSASGSVDAPVESPSCPFPPFLDTSNPVHSRAPSIRLPPVSSPTEELQVHDSIYANGRPRASSQMQWLFSFTSVLLPSVIRTLFPTLAGWKTKSFWERMLGVIAAPSVLLLTITVPVVEPAQQETSADPVTVVVTSADGGDSGVPAVRLPEDSPLVLAVDHRSTAEQASTGRTGNSQSGQGRQRWDSELPAVQSRPDPSEATPKECCQWLVWLQIFTGPFFVALIAWTAIDSDLDIRNFLLPSLLSLLLSLVCITGLITSSRHSNPWQFSTAWRPLLAFLGFIVAICWIATIATEVVSLLKTLGVILNISDSLLGLTVFAVGNSLGDLVADITVARLGYPVMALSACFGGPMLNILLGIGLGGLYMTLHAKAETVVTDGVPYEITISKVLIISGATLLSTLVGLLIVVPLNKWRMDRKIGWGLVILWCISTLTNVIAEVLT